VFQRSRRLGPRDLEGEALPARRLAAGELKPKTRRERVEASCRGKQGIAGEGGGCSEDRDPPASRTSAPMFAKGVPEGPESGGIFSENKAHTGGKTREWMASVCEGKAKDQGALTAQN